MLKLIVSLLLLFMTSSISNVSAAYVENPAIFYLSEKDSAYLSQADVEYSKIKASLPKDGNHYVPYTYVQTKVEVVERYQVIDDFSVNNLSTSNVEVQYTQSEITPVEWLVDKQIANQLAFSEPFLQQLSASLLVEAKQEEAAVLTAAYPANPIIAKKDENISIRVYQQAARSSGILYWYKYSSNGTFMGIFSQETAGNIAPIEGVTIDIVKY